MKILSATEIKQAKEVELTKDIVRTESVKNALDKATQQLNETDARFELALANQRTRWAKEEEEATQKILSMQAEVKKLEKLKEQALIPIEKEKELAHNMFKEAEKVLEEARIEKNRADERYEECEELRERLMNRLDEAAERATLLDNREQHILIREEAIDSERDQIKKLSKELSIKLSTL